MTTDQELIDQLLNSAAWEHSIISSGRRMYFEAAFLKQCVTQLQKYSLERLLDPDRRLTPLEILGMETLADALGVQLPTALTPKEPS